MKGGAGGGCSFAWDMIRFKYWKGRSHPPDTVCQTHTAAFYSSPPPHHLFFFFFCLFPFSVKHFSKWKILINFFFFSKRAKALAICFNTSKHNKVTYNQVFPNWCIKMLVCKLLPCIYDVRILLHYSFLLFSHADHSDPYRSLQTCMVIKSPFHNNLFPLTYKRFFH